MRKPRDTIVIGLLNKDTSEINRIRHAVGLSAVKMGERLCLRCDKLFYSKDLKNNKVCEACNQYGPKA